MTKLLALAATLTVLAAPAVAAAPHPVVVELFQSQGCSSCPPADANLARIAGQPGVIALSFAVTYWDNAAWKDTFARPAYTSRQWDYAHALHHAQVYTPQVVVDGRVDGDGIAPAAFAGLVATGAATPAGPAVDLAADRVTVAAGPAPSGGADVWLVRYDPHTVQVPIRGGENGGRTLPHVDIVKELVRLGAWTGAAAHYRLPPPTAPGLVTAILVQTVKGGPILAAARR
jgi:hypothetical protein